MKKLLKAMVISLFLGSMASSFAQLSEVKIGALAYGGPGCPAGTKQAALTGTGLAFYFDRFAAEVNPASPRFMSSSCNLAIPIKVPAGYSFAINAVKLRGYVDLPKSAKAKISSEYFFAGSRGVKLEKTYTGAMNTDIVLASALLASPTIWSACGQDTILRVNNLILLSAGSLNDSAQASIDNAQIEPSVHYQLMFKKCK